jgi:ketosteroid isomerase-like protein
MPDVNAEAVRALYERFGKGDFRSSVDLLDRDVRFLMLSDDPEADYRRGEADRLYLGVEGVAAGMRRLFEIWADLKMEAEEVTAVGDAVLVSVRQSGVLRVGGARTRRPEAPTEFHYFTLWTFRGRKVVQIENFRERAQALEAAGLSA